MHASKTTSVSVAMEKKVPIHLTAGMLFSPQNLWISLKSTLIRSQVTQLSIHTRDEFRLIQSMQSIYFDNSSDIESSSRQSTTGGSKKPVEHRIHPSHMYTVSKTSNSKKLLDTHFWDENTWFASVLVIMATHSMWCDILYSCLSVVPKALEVRWRVLWQLKIPSKAREKDLLFEVINI